VREARSAVMIVVELSWEDPGGKGRSISGRMEDKSLSGACLRVKTPIDLGAKLRIQSRFEQFSGVVRYCRRENWDYVVGVQREKTDSQSTSPPADIDVQVKSKGAAASDGEQTKVQSLSQAHEDTVMKVPAMKLVEEEPVVPAANRAAAMFPREIHREGDGEIGRGMAGREMVHRERLGPSQGEESGRARRATGRSTSRAKAREVPKERKSMARKWLELAPWQKRREGPIAGAVNNGGGDGKSAKENPMVEEKASANKAAGEDESAGTAGLQAELLPMEEIYRVAGIMSPQKGYSIPKVSEMINSEHLRGLSKEMRRAAVLMALEAAGMSIERVLEDAKARQGSLEAYETEQKKQVEAAWARKADDNVQIQEELERVKAQYMVRITRNLDGMAREKATFESWVGVKQQEIEKIAEVVELCAKPEAVEPVSAALAKVAVAGAGALASAAPVSAQSGSAQPGSAQSVSAPPKV
jgi:hypothetical protein